MGSEEATGLPTGSSLRAQTCLACAAWLWPPLCLQALSHLSCV